MGSHQQRTNTPLGENWYFRAQLGSSHTTASFQAALPAKAEKKLGRKAP